VPVSIQEEMRARGEKVVTTVPPGPDNPLGKYWIQLSAPGYGLHGTNAPGSIGKYATHGCLRLLPEHIERLYREARDGTRVEVVHEPVKLARDRAGRVYLEAHRVVYRDPHGGPTDLRARIGAAGLAEAIDWPRAEEVMQRAWGVPEDVTLTPASVPSEEPLAAQ
jgi:L,D-transpeptidase ErfK/SrfK